MDEEKMDKGKQSYLLSEEETLRLLESTQNNLRCKAIVEFLLAEHRDKCNELNYS